MQFFINDSQPSTLQQGFRKWSLNIDLGHSNFEVFCNVATIEVTLSYLTTTSRNIKDDKQPMFTNQTIHVISETSLIQKQPTIKLPK
jgi:hypothetical protein